MATPAISYTVREFVKSRLLDNSTGFNALMSQTATAYDVQDFQLSIQSTPPSLWLGAYDVSTLLRAGAQLPLAILSIAKDDSRGRLAMRVTPSTYSGPILVSLDFHVAYPMGGPPPDGEAMFHAVEEAVIGTFNAEVSYTSIPQGVTYNNEILVQQGRMEWQDSFWVQHIPCGLDFYRIA